MRAEDGVEPTEETGTDEALMANAAAGNRKAFGTLTRRHLRRSIALAQRVVPECVPWFLSRPPFRPAPLAGFLAGMAVVGSLFVRIHAGREEFAPRLRTELTAEPFDPKRLTALFDNIHANDAALRSEFEARVADTLSRLSPEGRLRLAESPLP